MWAIRIRLEQVLVNLISNALDAVENQPNPRVAIVVKGTEKGVQFSVKDNGLGIPSGDLSYLFDPFYTRKEVGKGLGLGLSIAYNIIQGFGGTIAVESLEHEGTEFIVTLQKGNH